MKSYIRILALLFLLAFIGKEANCQIPSQVVSALKTGNAKLLASALNENVELVILEQENVCSREQGEMILKDFFLKNKPVDFQLSHSGGNDSSYGIGKMQTQNGNYRIYFMLKSIDNKPFIVQLRIEKD